MDRNLKKHVSEATVTLKGQYVLELADNKLLHMWEAKNGLERRWKKQRWNRNLRRRIARLNRDIEKYARQLCEQNWCSRCDEMERGMSLTKTWNLLRHLLDPTNSKTQASISLAKTKHIYEGTDEEFVKEIIQTYIGDTKRVELPEYQGPPMELLDGPITEAEVRAEIIKLKSKSPGPRRHHQQNPEEPR